jgi:putative nucleotidyltransferase with HDIG domain
MTSVAIITESAEIARPLAERLAGIFSIQLLERHGFSSATPGHCVVVDIDLRNHSQLPELRLWLQQRPKDAKVIFAVPHGDRLQEVQAVSLGATDLVPRPLRHRDLLSKLGPETNSLVGGRSILESEHAQAVSEAIGALQNVFASACHGARLDPDALASAGAAVVSHIEEDGLVRWIDTVRKHHSQTYQHCLLVTGVAVSFGRQLGFSAVDRQRLAFAGLLHDVGKAKIPLAILEKPGPLDKAEIEAMKQHPRLGYESLRSTPGLDPAMLDMVVHHHEYLDGSGYPEGIAGREVSDLVRLMTISDIFGALVERRSYKPPLSGENAYQMLLDMEGKLDKDLVREFRPVSRIEIAR